MSKRTTNARQPGSHDTQRRTIWACWALIVLAGVAAYHNSFGGPFVLDDVDSIVDNPTIRHIWPITGPLCPPNEGQTVTGRPLVNVSVAINYALGGVSVTGYHVFNLAVHLAAALVLFGLIRRTCGLPGMPSSCTQAAVPLATAAATLWVLHPLTTAAVTYVIQRAESLVSLFYLLTLYALLRGATGTGRRAWYAAAVAACGLGVVSKEVIATAPLVALLYDRTFLAGSFAAALRRRWGLHAALAATWVPLAWLMALTGGRGGSAGSFLGSAPEYALTQVWAIGRYLRLAFWPGPLTFDYGREGAMAPGQLAQAMPASLAIAAVVVAVLLAGTIFALVRRPRAGFLGAAFFLILAPTSSFVPLVDPVFEHRMYLPLACVVTLIVVGGLAWLSGRGQVRGASTASRGVLAAGLVVTAAAALGWRTIHRNEDYRSVESIWRSAVGNWPDNARARHLLGRTLQEQGRVPDAIVQYREALRLRPNYDETLVKLGDSLQGLGRLEEAIPFYQRALALKPGLVEAHNNLGLTLQALGRLEEALVHFRLAVRIRPDCVEAHYNGGNALLGLGRCQEAALHYRQAIALRPGLAEAHYDLGIALGRLGQLEEAAAHVGRALQLRPDFPGARQTLDGLEALRRQRGPTTAPGGLP